MERAAVLFAGSSLIFIAAYILIAPFRRAISFTQDDAFFYFEIARRIGLGQGSTFDGITRTNGYHPLWQCLLVPFAPLMNASREFGARIVLLFSVALMALALCQIHRVATRLAPNKAWTGLLYVTLTLVWASIYGMESALAAFLLATMLTLVMNEEDLRSVPNGIKIGFASSLLVLSRLDAAVYIVALDGIWALLLLRASVRNRESWQPLLCCVAVQFCLIGLYFAHNQLEYGHLLTVSALAKAGRFHGVNTAWVRRPLCLVAMVNVGLGCLAVWVRRGQRNQLPLQAAMAGSCLTMLEVVLRGTFETLVWYHALTVFCGALFVPVLMADLGGRGRAGQLVRWGIACFGGLIFVQAVWSRLAQPSNIKLRYEKAVWIARYAPSNAVFAMTDSGMLGYRSERPVIDADGLTCSFDFQDAIHHDTLPGWMARAGVNYIVSDPYQRIVKTCDGHVATDIEIWEGMYGEQRHVYAIIEPVFAQGNYRLWRINSIRNGLSSEIDGCTRRAD